MLPPKATVELETPIPMIPQSPDPPRQIREVPKRKPEIFRNVRVAEVESRVAADDVKPLTE